MASVNESAVGSPHGAFAATRWSVVLAAGDASDTRAALALAELCRNYWYPLYAFVRRSGVAAQDAQDLTQEFFARMLEKKALAQADPRRGRFRAFLLSALKHFLVNEWQRARTHKRGGGHTVISLDLSNAEERYAYEPIDDQSPEKLFDRQWALAVLNQALAVLRQEYVDSRKGELFEALKDVLYGQAPSGQAEIARKLGLTEGAVSVAFHRLRRRYRAILRQQIAQTVTSAAEVDQEIRDLLNYL